MNDSILDRLRTPATPEEMHQLLIVEAIAKAERGFTQDGLNGYIITNLIKNRYPVYTISVHAPDSVEGGGINRIITG